VSCGECTIWCPAESEVSTNITVNVRDDLVPVVPIVKLERKIKCNLQEIMYLSSLDCKSEMLENEECSLAV
jgi:hypothetical protein